MTLEWFLCMSIGLEHTKPVGAPDQTRTGTLFTARDFKSLVSTYSTTGAFGCKRLDSNQRSPGYEPGDLTTCPLCNMWAVLVLAQEPNQPIGVSSEVDLANAIIGKVLLWII